MPILFPLICLVAMALALFRRSVPLSPAGPAVREDVVSLDQGDNDPALFLDLPCRRAQYGGAQG